MKFDRIDLWTMKSFLERIVTRGPKEEDVLVDLVNKIDLQLEGLSHVNTGKTGEGSNA